MNKEFQDLLMASPETVEAAAIQALATADERLLEQADQALHMRYFDCVERGDNMALDQLSESLHRIVLSKPGRKLYPDAATRRVVQWEHLHTLLDVRANDRSALEEAKEFLATTKYGKLIVGELRKGPAPKERLLEITGTSESSLSQMLAKLEVRGLVRRRSAGRKVMVSLGLIGVEVAASLESERSSKHSVAENLMAGAGAKLEAQIRSAALLRRIVRDLPEEGYAAIPRNLAKMFVAEYAKVADPATRAEAADTLGVAGDPRLRQPADTDYWVTLPGGSFKMGGGGTAQPERVVRVREFAIGRYPVTVSEYARYVDAIGSAPRGWAQQAQYPSRPVNNVTLEQAEGYCKWVGCRLATDAEWEFTARGPAGRVYPWGDYQPGDWQANFGYAIQRPTAVGLYPLGSTPEGVADLAGNVLEWTASGGRRGGDCQTPGPGLRAAEIRPRHEDSAAGFRCVREAR